MAAHVAEGDVAHHHVSGLHVAVDHAAPVRVGEAGSDLGGVAQLHGAERLASDVPPDDEVVIIGKLDDRKTAHFLDMGPNFLEATPSAPIVART